MVGVEDRADVGVAEDVAGFARPVLSIAAILSRRAMSLGPIDVLKVAGPWQAAGME